MAGPLPNKVSTSHLVSRFLKVAQTSVYRVKFQPPLGVQNFLTRSRRGFDYTTFGRDIEILCSEASLPGTTLATHDVTADYQGVTEKMAYRRIYDESLDLAFVVDKKYNIIEFFEGWMDYISGVGLNGVRGSYEATPIGYRMSYPKEYKNNIYVTKFEKDMQDNQLQYTFVDAFPTSINSTPVSYAESDVLRYNVSFSYVRYVRYRTATQQLSPQLPLVHQADQQLYGDTVPQGTVTATRPTPTGGVQDIMVDRQLQRDDVQYGNTWPSYNTRVGSRRRGNNINNNEAALQAGISAGLSLF